MAAPHVAGAMAILKQRSPSARPQELLGILQSSGVDVLDGRGNNLTKRRLRLSNNLPWAARYAAPAFQTRGLPPAVTTDVSGSFYLLASEALCTDVCYSDRFVLLKYNNDGLLVWQDIYSNGGAMYWPGSLAADGSGNLLVTGAICSLNTDNECAAWNTLVIKYDRNGVRQWTATLSKSFDTSSTPQIAADSFGNVYVATTTCAGDCYVSTDYAVAKYAPTGELMWLRTYPNAGDDQLYAMAVDAAGNAYVTGMMCTDADCSFASAATLALRPNGTVRWLRRHGGGPISEAYAIGLDSAGNVYVTGLETDADALNNNFLTLSYGSNGQQRWVRRFHYDANDVAWSLAVDASRNVYVTGENFLTIKYNTNGALQWSQRFPAAPWNGYASMIRSDSAGNVFVAGQMHHFTEYVDDNGIVQTTTDGRYALVRYSGAGAQLWSTEYAPNPQKAIQADGALAVRANSAYLGGLSCADGDCGDIDLVAFKHTPAP